MALPKAPFEISQIQDYTDEELARFIAAAPVLPGNGTTRIFMITPCILAKSVNSREEMLDEAAAQQKAYQLGVPVPVVYRTVSVVTDGIHSNYIIMKHICGPTLEDAWTSLSLPRSLYVACQLRASLRALHALRSQTTGQLHTGSIRSNFIQAVHRPKRASPWTFTGWLNYWLHKCPLAHRPKSTSPMTFMEWLKYRLRKCPLARTHSGSPFRFSPEPYHVFIHQDLAARNMIIDESFRLWIIDWGLAGFYPRFMEKANMRSGLLACAGETTWGAWWARVRWRLLCWIVLGFDNARYNAALSALGTIQFFTTRFSLFRTPYD